VLTHHEVLGVERRATTDEIRAAYRHKAQLLHPDQLAGAPNALQEAATLAMARVNAAHEVLTDPARRAEYDETVKHLADAPVGRVDADMDRRGTGRWVRPRLADRRRFVATGGMPLDFGHLAGIDPDALVRLDANRALVSDDDLRTVTNMAPALEDLDLSSALVTDAGVPHLLRLPALHSLDLSGTAITDAALEVIGRLEPLAALTLVDTAVSDAGLERLSTLRLTYLLLRGSPVKGPGLLALEALPLEMVGLPHGVPRSVKKELLRQHPGIHLV
jgi:hypothetical protein